VGGTDENATAGFLVVQVRGLGTVPGKIPQAAARLTSAPTVANFKPCKISTLAKFQPLNGARAAGSRITRSCIAVELRTSSKSIGLY
jgi:hypothetical protein